MRTTLLRIITGVGGPETIECPATPVFSEPSASDLCDDNPLLTFEDVTTPGDCPQEYSVTRTWTATDACGNSSQASQTINVEDNTAPVLEGMPVDVTVACGEIISIETMNGSVGERLVPYNVQEAVHGLNANYCNSE